MSTNGKPFSDLQGEIENGRFLNDLTEQTYALVASVMETRKVGKMTITLDFHPTGKGTVNIDAEYKIKEPEHDRPTTTFFVGSDLSLQRNDPSQPRLPLREVADNQDPVRVVNETR